jgi:hypothetical protein
MRIQTSGRMGPGHFALNKLVMRRNTAADDYGVADAASGTAKPEAGVSIQKFSLSGGELDDSPAGGGEGRVPLRGFRAFPVVVHDLDSFRFDIPSEPRAERARHPTDCSRKQKEPAVRAQQRYFLSSARPLGNP